MKQLFTLVLLALSTTCMAQSTVTVKVDGLDNDTAVVSLISKDFTRMEEPSELLVKDGVFTYTMTDDVLRVARMSFKLKDAMKFTMVYFVPGQNGSLHCTADGDVWSGIGFYGEKADMDAALKPTKDALYAAIKDYQNNQANDSIAAVYERIAEEKDSLNQSAIMAYIKAHPSSGASVIAILNDMGDTESAETAMAALSPDMKTSVYSPILNMVEKAIAAEKAQAEAAKKVANGCMSPDFTLKSIDGSDFTLSSLRGKYVVLDFWGSWCGWCIKGMPDMKTYYAKYAGKYEVVGVDCRDTEEKWKAAVAKHELPWKHVYCPNESTLLTDYAIGGFPTKIIIDPEGRIVHTVVGEDPAFYKYLDELLQK